MKCRSLLLVPAAHPIDRLADWRQERTEDRQPERGADDRPNEKARIYAQPANMVEEGKKI